MSHVDEGTLHAYLDRGDPPSGDWRELEDHLTTCAECRQQLEKARVLRERAAAILDASGPAAVSVPPFDSVLARAGRPTPRRILGINRLRALGWAASIALAVGVGWLARGALNPLQSPEQSVTRQTARTAAVDSPAPTASPGARPGTASEPEVHQSTIEGPPKAQNVDAAAERLRMTYAVTEEAKPTDEAAAGREDVAQRNAAEPVPPTSRGAPTAVAPQAKLAQDVGVVAERREQPARARAAELEAVPTLLRWEESDSADAATRLGDMLHAVPGVPVVRIEREVHKDGRAVRILQDLDGVTLEIIQRPVTSIEGRAERDLAADVQGAVDSGEATITVIRGTVLLTLRAPVPTDSLRSLAARIP